MDKALDDLQALGELLLDLLGARGPHLLLQLRHRGPQIHAFEHVADGFGAHLGREGVVPIFIDGLPVFGIREQLLQFQRSLAWINHHVVLIIDDALKGAGRHIEQQTEAARHALEEPDMGDGHGEFDMSHPLAAYAGDGHFDAATIADDVFVLDPLVFSAGALVIAHRSKDLLAEETAGFRLEGAVVDRLGILDLAARPRADAVRGGDRDRNAVERILVKTKDGAGLFAGSGDLFGTHEISPRLSLKVAETRRFRMRRLS